MAFYDSCLAGLELMNKPSEAFSEEQINILNALARGMQPDEFAAVADAAQLLDSLCPPWEPDRGEKSRNYWWEVFRLLVAIAKSSDVLAWIQERLIAIILELRKIQGDKELVYASETGHEIRVHIWKDVLLREDLAEHIRLGFYADPTSENRLSAFNASSAQRYQNISWFAARLQAAGILLIDEECVFALKNGLETDLSTLDATVAECRILVACGWLVNCPKELLGWSRAYDVSEQPPKYEPQWGPGDEYPRLVPNSEVGPLYSGPPTLCPERWAFWLARLDEIASEESGFGNPVRYAAFEAAKAMRAAEEEAGKE
ncbi:hypothetical protein VTJ49DRAFT_1112 [Mycothermus thermophilus]|uniref:Uncharacterized protein n=1 Tax=Humicola insolens TaxID=85995 RepID=A0ABR3VNQ5_HUMIN